MASNADEGRTQETGSALAAEPRLISRGGRQA